MRKTAALFAGALVVSLAGIVSTPTPAQADSALGAGGTITVADDFNVDRGACAVIPASVEFDTDAPTSKDGGVLGLQLEVDGVYDTRFVNPGNVSSYQFILCDFYPGDQIISARYVCYNSISNDWDDWCDPPPWSFEWDQSSGSYVQYDQTASFTIHVPPATIVKRARKAIVWKIRPKLFYAEVKPRGTARVVVQARISGQFRTIKRLPAGGGYFRAGRSIRVVRILVATDTRNLALRKRIVMPRCIGCRST